MNYSCLQLPKLLSEQTNKISILRFTIKNSEPIQYCNERP